MEVLKNRDDHSIRLAPLFDHGLSFYFSCHNEKDLRNEDPMADKKIQSRIPYLPHCSSSDLPVKNFLLSRLAHL